MSEIREWFAGRKTYFIAAVAIIGYVAACAQGEVTPEDAIGKITLAVLAVCLRAGVAKVGLAQAKAWLAGKKTYVVGAAAIVGYVAAFATEKIELAEMIQMVVAAVTAMTIRAGVKTAGG